MGLIPQNGVSLGEVIVGIIRSRIAAAVGSSVLDAPVRTGIGNVEELGIPAVGTVDTAGVQDLAVSVDLSVGVLVLYLLERIGPEAGAETVMVIGSLDVLRCVKTEAIRAGSDQLIHIVIDSGLNTAVLGLQIGQTGCAVTGEVVGGVIICVVALDVLHLFPRSVEQLVVIDLGLKLRRFGSDVRHRIGAGVAVVAVFGTHMVDNSVNDDL